MSDDTVWILGAGQYSDWHIVGVFATREAAEETRQRMLDNSRFDFIQPDEPEAFPLNRVPMVRATRLLVTSPATK